MTTGPATPSRFPGLPLTERPGDPHADARGITEDLIRDVVDEFYRRTREDDELGPIFNHYVQDWDHHLAKMVDFWSAALLKTGRYSGRPVERHRLIAELSVDHFHRWIELFDATTHDLCPPADAQAFLTRAHKMRDAMTKNLGAASARPLPDQRPTG